MTLLELAPQIAVLDGVLWRAAASAVVQAPCQDLLRGDVDTPGDEFDFQVVEPDVDACGHEQHARIQLAHVVGAAGAERERRGLEPPAPTSP